MSLWTRPRKDGQLVYYWKVRWKRNTYQGYIGPVSRSTAKRIELSKKAEIAEGHYSREIAPMTLGSLTTPFLRWFAATHEPSSTERYEARLRLHLLPAFDGIHLAQITTHAIERYVATRREAKARPNTINGELAVLRQMLTKAREWGLLASDHRPTLRKLTVDETPIHVLTAEEETRLLAHAQPGLKPVILFGLHTGLRRNELSALCWRHIDWERREVEVAHSKSHKTRRVPLNAVAWQALSMVERGALQAKIFGYAHIGIIFERARNRAGLPHVHPHVMRYTFATRCLERGINIRTVQRWLGHASLKHTERYLRPSVDHEQQAIRLLEPTVHRMDTPAG